MEDRRGLCRLSRSVVNSTLIYVFVKRNQEIVQAFPCILRYSAAETLQGGIPSHDLAAEGVRSRMPITKTGRVKVTPQSLME